ncbi:unnamed protein product [Plutella xylostella]|uniref:(diamondback moth) hypothetical protein n=1 Tax=Plutella xylostella TaxID=51655 RepID=A0A8S4DP65_PLUXY|nr:unnamed protein product [Plutella xylostella]
MCQVPSEIIPEQAGVTYFNTKFISNVTFKVFRYGRKSSYYAEIVGTNLHTWDNNITAQFVFFESFGSSYKRSFVEFKGRLCDLFNDSLLTTLLADTGYTCPVPPKTAKYSGLVDNYIFVPVALETTEIWGHDGKIFFKTLGRRMRDCGLDIRSGAFLMQRISLAVQRGNACQVPSEIIPEQAGVTYFNTKFISNVTFKVFRYGRKSSYYAEIVGTNLHTWDNNITAQFVFFESFGSSYKRSFVEFKGRLCDLFNDSLLTTLLADTGYTCPVPPVPELAAKQKIAKYSLVDNYIFVPVALETTEIWGHDGKIFFKTLGRRMRDCGLDIRSGAFLMQRISLAVQRGNAVSALGTFASDAFRSEDT